MTARTRYTGRARLRHALTAFIVTAVIGTAGGFTVPPVAAQEPKLCQRDLFGSTTTTAAKVACIADPIGSVAAAAALPTDFSQSVVFSGLVNPTNIEFAADGRVFVAEKSGRIKVFENLTDPTPTVFSSLEINVHDFWDRGLLGLALDPSLANPALPSRPWLYVLYTYDHILGSSMAAPRWGDACANPPGATTDGCVVSGRLSRFSVTGTVISGPEQVLIEDWCQQYPSHSVGSIGFGPDGALYVSGGDGASFTNVDYGQYGGSTGSPTPKNPCGDPPGGAMTPPTAQGGSLRSQDILTSATSTGSTYATTVLADGPVAYWRVGEASGTTAADGAGTNVGTYTGNYTLAQAGAIAGDTNSAVKFSGTGHIEVPDAAALDRGAGPFSLELWAKRDDAGAYYQMLYSKGSQGNAYFYQNRFTFDDNASTRHIKESGVTTDTAWHHFVVTVDGTTRRLYKDGVDVTVEGSPFRLSANALPARIGSYYPAGATSLPFVGTVDEVALYPTALSAARVQAHLAAATGQGGGTSSDPTSLDGAILRVDPVTGSAFAGNPFTASNDLNKRRIIAHGLRNPFRFELRPGTNELWLGDVGWGDWEELNRIANVSDSVAENFGWPCYEGAGRQGGYDSANLSICEDLYAAGPVAVTGPVYAYRHSDSVASGDGCPTGSSAVTGMTFYPESGGSFPSQYRGGLFFADHNRSCIWWMAKGANGQPDPATRAIFLSPAPNPVDLEIGPDGALYFADFEGNTVRKIAFTSGNQPPTAIATAAPASGPSPLAVQFDGTTSTDPENGSLVFAWDLDGDGAYDDSTSPNPTRTYTAAGNVTVGLKVTDPGAEFGTDTVVVSVANTPPVPAIAAPAVGTTWKVGDQIAFSGSATDAEDVTVPATRLSWQLTIQHCPSNCHGHDIQQFPAVASGSFAAPDHEHPSYLDLTLTATDSNGVSASTTRRLDPRTMILSFQTAPTGLQLAVNGVIGTAPFDRTVIEGSANSVSATSPQALAGSNYTFQTWSDAGAANHTVTAGAAATLTATYATSTGSTYATTVLADGPVAYWRVGEASGTTAADGAGTNVGTYTGNYTLAQAGAIAGDTNSAVKFSGTGHIEVPDAAALDRGAGPFSLELWAKRDDAGAYYQMLYSKGSQGNAYFYQNRFTFDDNASTRHIKESGVTTDTAWHHFVVTVDGTTRRLYKDGVDVTVEGSPFRLSANALPARIGSYYPAGATSLPFVGTVDEVALYPTALSAARVQAHLAAAQP